MMVYVDLVSTPSCTSTWGQVYVALIFFVMKGNMHTHRQDCIADLLNFWFRSIKHANSIKLH